MQELRNLIVTYLTALWHWRWQALGIAWFICLIGWAVIAILPDRYTVTARLVVDTETILGPLMEDIAVTPDFDRQVKMIRETLFSVPNMIELIERTGIDKQREMVSDIDRAALIARLTKQITLEVDSSNLFTIAFSDKDPDMAHRVVATMMDIFIQKNLGHSQQDVEKATKFIEEQIAIYDQKLRDADLKVAEFQREHSDELGGAERNVRELERAEADERRLRTELEAGLWRRDQLKLKLDATPRTIPASQTVGATSGAQRYLEELGQELAKKRLLYTEQHPDIITLRQLIAEASRQLKEDKTAGVGLASTGVQNPLHDQLVSQLEVAEVSVDDLSRRLKVAEQEVSTLSERVRQSPKAEADLKRLTRDYDVLLTQYAQLTKRRESTQLATNLDAGRQRAEFRIVDPPVRPLEPSGPLHGLLLVAVLIVGIGVGGGFAIMRFMLSGAVLTAAQLQSAFKKIPVLGSVTTVQLPGARGMRVMNHLGMASCTLTLILICGILFYFYEISSVKLHELASVANLPNLLASKEASAGL